jgi:hypothetical protein
MARHRDWEGVEPGFGRESQRATGGGLCSHHFGTSYGCAAWVSETSGHRRCNWADVNGAASIKTENGNYPEISFRQHLTERLVGLLGWREIRSVKFVSES